MTPIEITVRELSAIIERQAAELTTLRAANAAMQALCQEADAWEKAETSRFELLKQHDAVDHLTVSPESVAVNARLLEANAAVKRHISGVLRATIAYRAQATGAREDG